LKVNNRIVHRDHHTYQSTNALDFLGKVSEDGKTLTIHPKHKSTIKTELYMSYNWRDYADVPCGTKGVWSVRENMHGKLAGQVVPSLEAAIKKLKELGADESKIEKSNHNWSYGCGPELDDGPLDDSARNNIFLHHMNYFLSVCEKFPNTVCVSDSCDLLGKDHVVGEGDKAMRLVVAKEEEKENDQDDPMDLDNTTADDTTKAQVQMKLYPGVIYMLNEKKQPFTHYRDEARGNMLVNSFADAMYVYGVMSQKEDRRAQSWLLFAFDMPDAPYKLASKD